MFVTGRDRQPWFLVEVKSSDTSLSKSLDYFKEQSGVPHAFQAVQSLDHVRVDLSSYRS